MKDLFRLVAGLPKPVTAMLASAAARAVSFFALLPYFPIYLHDTLALDVGTVGYVLGGSLLVGTVVSVYGGYLADRFPKVNIMIVLDLALVVLYAVLPLVGTAWVVIAMLVAGSIASSSMSVANNALLSELVPQNLRAKVFSLRYSLQNVGAAVGPFLGLGLAVAHPGGPFVLGAVVILAALLPLILLRRQFPGAAGAAGAAPATRPMGFGESLVVMRSDRRLLLFTLGGFFSLIVYGPLLTYMGQYLVLVAPGPNAYETVAVIAATNAVLVVVLQYALGSRLRPATLLRWLTLGSAAFVVGLVGLSVSNSPLPAAIAVAVFTIGEVVVVPAEYMFVDSITPEHMRGSYFGAQNLIHLGIAVGPALAGFTLTVGSPALMFASLIAATVLGWWFYVLGCRAGRRGAPAPTRAAAEVGGGA